MPRCTDRVFGRPATPCQTIASQSRRVCAAVLMVCVLLAGSVQAARPSGASLAKYLPDDVGFFLQVNDLGLLLQQLSAGPILQGVLDAGGSGAGGGLAPFEHAFRGTLGLSWVEAQRYLFTGEAALAAPGVRLADLQQMVLLVRLPNNQLVKQVAKRTGGIEQGQGPKGGDCFLLPSGLHVAAYGRFLVFGSRRDADPRCLFDRVCVNLSMPLEPAGRLAQAATFRHHLQQLTCKKRGVLYADYRGLAEVGDGGPSPASRPVPWLIWPGVKDFMAGLTVAGQTASWELIATREDLLRSAQNELSTLPVAELPADTLVAWSGRVEARRLFYRLLDDPGRGDLRLYLLLAQLLVGQEELEAMLEALGPQFVLVMGRRSEAPRRYGEGLQIPAISLMVQVKSRAVVQAGFERWAEGMRILLNALSVPLVGCRPLNVAADTRREQTVKRMSLAGLMCERTRCPFLQTLQLAWTVDDDWLIVSSHPAHLEELLDARAGHGEQLRQGVELSNGGPDAGARLVVIARPRRVAEMVQSWLDYLAAEHPESLEIGWWHRRVDRPPTPATTLGAQLEALPHPAGQILVSNVRRGHPAHGKLHDGDRIIAVEHERLRAGDPLGQVQRAILRNHTRGTLAITIKRNAEQLDIRLHLPKEGTPQILGGDPMLALRRVVAIGSHLEGFRLTLHPTPPQELHASGSLQLPADQSRPADRPLPLR